MRSRTLLFACFAVGMLALPVAASAAIPFFGPIIPNAYNQCAGSWGLLVTVINNVIQLLITLALVIVAPVTIAYAGFLFVVNPVDPGGKAKAKSILRNTIVGIVIALAGWLIVDALMAVLLNPTAFNKTWSELITGDPTKPCIPLPTSLNQAGPGQGITGVAPDGTITTTGGNIPSKVGTAANSYIGVSTSAGPSGGNKACAWAVNNVLANAGVASIDGNSVQAMESALRGGRGALISTSAAQPGDLVIEAGARHVGICLNAGCSQVVSNSSSRASFSWRSGPDFDNFYGSGTGRIYRISN